VNDTHDEPRPPDLKSVRPETVFNLRISVQCPGCGELFDLSEKYDAAVVLRQDVRPETTMVSALLRRTQLVTERMMDHMLGCERVRALVGLR